ncbi:hypothetical protein K504DRAFT_456509 [Pleomassaria siparia CBS 279.74]|uniref:Rhodopsin domain-containing protein n=1 Tax=Pleomassaria siparia CBS 279.74 TaxID=1314801 RepID=A0A6G1K6R6_9PLEO|nr:hypothetical protein K504DRAFT_456509 [Pleomassaria siparia CBS 279.74]
MDTTIYFDPTSGPTNEPPPYDYTSQTNAFIIAVIGLLMLANLIRTIATKMQQKTFTIENLGAHVSFILAIVMLLLALAWSLAGGTTDLVPPPMKLMTDWYLPFLGTYYATMFCIKLSLLIFYVDVFSGGQSLGYRLQGTLGNLIILNGLVLILWTFTIYAFFMATVMFWNQTIAQQETTVQLFNLHHAGYQAAGIGNALTDLSLLALAIGGIMSTMIPTRQKIKTCALLLLGLFATFASIFRACQANIDMNQIWSPAHQNVAHIVTITCEVTFSFFALCLPSIKFIFFTEGRSKKWFHNYTEGDNTENDNTRGDNTELSLKEVLNASQSSAQIDNDTSFQEARDMPPTSIARLGLDSP